MIHLTDDQLRDWQTAGRGGEAVIGHLAECDECGARLAAIVRDQPVDGDASMPDTVAYLERGYAAYRSASRVPWRGIAVVAGVAAAIVVAIIVPGRMSVSRQPLQRATESTIRGATIRVLEPIDSATLPLKFSWSSPARAVSYRVEIDDGSTPVLSAGTSENTLTLAPDIASRLQVDRPYRWRVVALASDGDVLADSAWTSFRLTR
jgi:hypothetical protein